MYSSGNKKILQIAMLFTVSLVAPFVTYGALPVVAPNASTYADTEAVTNVAFNAGDKNDRLFNLTLELDATVSNNVSVAFGCDVNENGLLEREEADAVVGWDSGAWFYQDRRAHVEEQIARESSHRMLNWQLILSSRRTAKSLVSTDNDGAVFGNAIPPTMFDPEWNLMQVTTRGLSDPNGVVVTQARGWGFNVRVR